LSNPQLVGAVLIKKCCI